MAPTTALVLAGASGANPLIPAAWELTLLLVFGAMCAVLVVAVITSACDRCCTPVQRLLRLLVILVAPGLGAVLWLAVGRYRVLDRPGI